MKTSLRRSALVCAGISFAVLAGCACNQEAPVAAAPAAAPVAAAPVAAQTVTENFVVDAAELFDFDSAALRTDAAASLDALVRKYRGNARLVKLSIVGHTDSVGDDAYNQGLSERRAAAVRDHLVSEGVDGTKIVASGRGESQPVASNDTEQGRQKNRRVELTAELQREVTR